MVTMMWKLITAFYRNCYNGHLVIDVCLATAFLPPKVRPFTIIHLFLNIIQMLPFNI